MQVIPNSAQAWFLAARPKTLPAALVPVVTATALAWSKGEVNPVPVVLCMLFACLMQVAANLINDLYDFLRGSDRADRLGPERACQQGWITPRAMRFGIALTLLMACSCGLGLLPYGGVARVALGVACVVFAFLYTTLLSYVGCGDVLVLVFFGLVPVLGTYYVLRGELCTEAWWLAAACGTVVDTLLVVNNYRDREQDLVSGKRTLIVLIGGKAGAWLYLLLGLAAYVMLALVALNGYLWTAILPLFYLLPHYLTWRKMVKIGQGMALNRVLGFTARNILTFGVLAALSFLLP